MIIYCNLHVHLCIHKLYIYDLELFFLFETINDRKTEVSNMNLNVINDLIQRLSSANKDCV